MRTLFALMLLAIGGCDSPYLQFDPVIEQEENPTQGRNAPRWHDGDHLVLISFDGFSRDYIDRFQPPNFLRVAREGVRARGMIPPFPSKTFPSHYSVATGLWSGNHGIVGNRFWDPDRGSGYALSDRSAVEDGSWYGGEPIWVTAELQGMVAAAFFFVGSEANVKGVRPSYWYRFNTLIRNETRVQQVLNWLQMPPETRPRLITLYFSDVDTAGHDFGPDSAELKEAVLRVDALLGQLLDGIDSLAHGDRVSVVLTSDHGMASYHPDNVHVVDFGPYADLVTAAELGPYGSVHLRDRSPSLHREVRDHIAAQLPEDIGVFVREDLPSRFHFAQTPRAGDIVLVPPLPHMLITADRPKAGGYTHGWDPSDEAMHGIFVARGPEIRPGSRIPTIRNIDVYPLMAELLGLKPAAVDGSLAPFLDVLVSTEPESGQPVALP